MPIQKRESIKLDLSGKISTLPVNWKSYVFRNLPGYSHTSHAGVFMERFTSDDYLDLYPSDAFLVYKSLKNLDRLGPDEIPPSSTCNAYNSTVFPCLDVILSKLRRMHWILLTSAQSRLNSVNKQQNLYHRQQLRVCLPHRWSVR